MIYDCVIIGAGVVGAFIARCLSKFNLNVVCLEAKNDACCLQSKANSAIVHQGFDPLPGTLKALLNREGARLFPKVCRELGVPFKKIGALILSRDTDSRHKIVELQNRAFKNKCAPLIYMPRRHLLRFEKNIGDEVKEGLFAPNSGIVDPFLLTIRACESAFLNGVKFLFNTAVNGFRKEDDGIWSVKTNNGEYKTKVVINSAGIYSDEINNLVSQQKYYLKPVRGDYMVMHKSQNGHVKHTIFNLPTEKGKGILVTPTTSGNILLGPTHYDITDKEGSNVTYEGVEEIKQKTALNVKNIDYTKIIRMFAGIRSHEEKGDFVIQEAYGCKNFINLIGIESPGLTAAPGIAEYILNKFISNIFNLKYKFNYKPYIKKEIVFSELNQNQKRHYIGLSPLYKNVICKCEYITEAEVVDAISRCLGATDVEGVKKRTRCMMGMCQGGYCQKYIQKILNKNLQIKQVNNEKI